MPALGRPSRLAALAVLLIGLVAVAVFATGRLRADSQPAPPVQPAAAHPMAFFDEHLFAEGLAQAEAAPVNAMGGAQVFIIPHHWLAGSLILGGIRDMAASSDISRVILLGPDHINAGSGPATTSPLAWETPFGRLEPDSAAVDRLSTGGFATSDPDVLGHEHSIAGIVHAVAYYLPGARVIPLALRHDITPDELDALTAALAGEVDEHTAVIAAVDFSHYLPEPEAAAMDRESIDALEDMDAARIMTFGNEHLDSPPSIVIAMELARLLGATHFELRRSTNSGLFNGDMSTVTSYVEGYYAVAP